MTGKMNYVNDRRGGRRRDERSAEEGFWESPRLPPVEERTGRDQALLDQGLRLNRAFVSIKDPLVREAIINLVVDAARNQNGAELPHPAPRRPKNAAPEGD